MIEADLSPPILLKREPLKLRAATVSDLLLNVQFLAKDELQRRNSYYVQRGEQPECKITVEDLLTKTDDNDNISNKVEIKIEDTKPSKLVTLDNAPSKLVTLANIPLIPLHGHQLYGRNMIPTSLPIDEKSLAVKYGLTKKKSQKTLQEKVYVFLELPEGSWCMIYHLAM